MQTLTRGPKQLLTPKYITLTTTISLLIVFYVTGAALYGGQGFLTMRTFMNLFIDNAHIGISAVGMTLVLISGGIDLSVGAVAALTTMLVAFGSERLGINPFVCTFGALLLGAFLGFLMGGMIQVFQVPPFIATLSGMFFARGLCAIISRDSIAIRAETFSALAAWKITLVQKPRAYINFAVFLFIAVLLIGIYITRYTKFGRNVYAIGGNEQSARLMGLPVSRTKIAVYTINGFCSALAGIAFALYTKSGWSLNLMGMELDVIAAAVIGGTLLTGGVGSVFGTLFGAIMLALIPTFITFNGKLDSWWGKIFIGALLLLFIGLQRVVVVSSAKRAKDGK